MKKSFVFRRLSTFPFSLHRRCHNEFLSSSRAAGEDCNTAREFSRLVHTACAQGFVLRFLRREVDQLVFTPYSTESKKMWGRMAVDCAAGNK